MPKKIILTLLLILTCAKGWSQQSPYSTANLYQGIPTPQAATLGTFGDIPVSLYTGTVNISVPIYKATVRDVTLDVRLDYDGSGLRMSQLPGPTGEGWHLNCGGVITRKINGHPDEFIPNSLYTQAFGLKQPYFRCCSQLPELVNSPTDNYKMLRDTVYSEKYDFDPDVFYFNFMGFTGHFFLGNDGEWHVDSDRNVDVLLDISDLNDSTYYKYPLFTNYPGYSGSKYLQPKVIDRIKLRDENGNIYEFGGKQDNAVEYSMGLLNMSIQQEIFPWNSNAWYLTRVTDRLGNVLYEFEYERGYYIAQLYKTAVLTKTEEEHTETEWEFLFDSTLLKYYDMVMTGNFGYPYSGTVSLPVYLSQVKCANGCKLQFNLADNPLSHLQLWGFEGAAMQSEISTHTFGYNGNQSPLPCYYLQVESGPDTLYQYRGMGAQEWLASKPNNPLVSTRAKDLTSIKVSTEYNGISQTYTLHYDYSPRMHLTEMTVTGSDSTSVPSSTPMSYMFRYDNYDHVPGNHMTDSVDHWGYFVGRRVTLPNGIVDTSKANEYSISRNPDPVAMKYGSLNKIIYPTGGMTVLEYEPHDFSICSKSDRVTMYDTIGVAGGLRIKSISLYNDTLSQDLLSRRTFTYKLQQNNMSSGQLYSQPMYWWQDWTALVSSNNRTSANVSMFHTASILPLANSTGTHIGYTEVQERFHDGSENRYTFTGLQNNNDKRFLVCYTDDPSPYDTYGERQYRRGRLTSLEQYDTTGNLVRREQSTWPDSIETVYTLASNMFAHFGSGSETCYVAGGVYQMFSPKRGVTQTTTTEYLNGSNITRNTANQYAVRNLDMTHPYAHRTEVMVPIRRTENTVYENEAVAWEYPFTESQELPDRVKKEFCLHPHKTSYYTNGTKVKEDSVIYSNVQTNGTYHQLPCNVMERTGRTPLFTRTTFSEYTATGRPRFVKEYGRPDLHLLWDFKDNYLIAKCEGEGSVTWPASVGPDNFFNAALHGHLRTFRNCNLTHLITTYTYNPFGGLTSVTTPDSVTTFYKYDTLMRLKYTYDSNNNIISTYDYDYRLH